MKKLNTHWSNGTRNIFKAICDLISALQTGENYFIAYIDNKDCSFPIKIKNPLLNKKENWSWAYACSQTKKELEEKSYFNETEKDLTLHYDYDWKNKKIVKRKNDQFVPSWKPKNNMEYHVLNPNIKKVFVVAKSDIKKHHFKSKKIKWRNIILFLVYPLKFIPSYSNLEMDEYTCHSFRIGGIVNGFNIEVQIPKKFAFEK